MFAPGFIKSSKTFSLIGAFLLLGGIFIVVIFLTLRSLPIDLSYSSSNPNYSVLIFIKSNIDLIIVAYLIVLSLWSLFLLTILGSDQGRKGELETALADKQEIISVAAHEIGAPLTNIKGTLSIIAKEPALSTTSQKFIERALISVEELIKLIGDLLTISRFERGKLKVVKAEMDFETLCQEVVDQLKSSADKEGLVLEYQKPKNALPVVNLDASRLREVIINLIDNAVKYASEGSILVTSNIVDGNLLVSVSDNGPGIGPADLKLLFKRFVRLPVTRDGHGGVGLGLYISRLIVEAHGGKIWAESKVGQGTTFYFSLPIS